MLSDKNWSKWLWLILVPQLCVAGTLECESRLFRAQGPVFTPQLTADRAKTARLTIEGGQKLSGVVRVDPAKNAYLPILVAALLNTQPVQLVDVPQLRDMDTLLEIFRSLGVGVQRDGAITTLDASTLNTNIADCELVKTMRASILVLGPLLGRFQAAKVALPGGCPIGARPIDIHLSGFKALGADVDEHDEYVVVGSSDALRGTELDLKFPSVGATQNLIMGAVLAKGHTVIRGAAREPEVEDLIDFLNAMGARVRSNQQGEIHIDGVKSLAKRVAYRAIGDRIEAATYIIGALMTKSELRVEGFNPEHIRAVLDTLIAMGAKLEIGADYVRVMKSGPLRAVDVVTAPHPGFPTDAQAQLMALMTQAQGTSSIRETIFESRYLHAAELAKMGAQIEVDGDRAIIHGGTPLHGSAVKSTDLRGGAALLISALAASGPTTLTDIFHIERGYSHYLEKLARVGVSGIRRSE